MDTLAMNFGEGVLLSREFSYFSRIIVDRGSVYSVAVGFVSEVADVKVFLKQVKKLKNHHKATHHSYAARVAIDGVLRETRGDDGEAGAGEIILRMMRKRNLVNAAVCVVRWYGGVMLHADRFKHVQDAATYGIEQALQ